MALALLYHGGFHALQLQRVAHALWQACEFSAALRIQAGPLSRWQIQRASQWGAGDTFPVGCICYDLSWLGDEA